MKCRICSGKVVFDVFCKDHFIKNFENNVLNTINKFNLINKNDKIAVACSGGKDSLSILYVANKNFKDVTAIAIDEGIAEYRDITLEDLKSFCDKNNIKLKIYSYKNLFGNTLDSMKAKIKLNPCSICGVFRRTALNKAVSEFDVLVTGHNMDDEVQAIVMNFLKGNLEFSARLGPRSGISDEAGFTPRVKPLYFCSEKETTAYAFLKGFEIRFTECPNAKTSFRAEVRDVLNDHEARHPGTKRNIVDNFLSLSPSLKSRYSGMEKPIRCNNCGEPCKNGVCQACSFISILEAT